MNNNITREKILLETDTVFNILKNKNDKSTLFIETRENNNKKYISGSFRADIKTPAQLTLIKNKKVVFSGEIENKNIFRDQHLITQLIFTGSDKNIELLRGVYKGKNWENVNLKLFIVDQWAITRLEAEPLSNKNLDAVDWQVKFE